MVLFVDIVNRCKRCVIIMQIKAEKESIEKTRQNIVDRSHKYHNGRLEVDNILDGATKDSRARIFRLKRKLLENE